MKVAEVRGGQYFIPLVKRTDEVEGLRKKALSFYLLCDFCSFLAWQSVLR
jgi:hypothetical protein